MAYAEYGLPYKDHNDKQNPVNQLPSIRLLEDEIQSLRRTMELTYLQEARLCSEVVIEISRKLDVKINEYMQVKRATVS